MYCLSEGLGVALIRYKENRIYTPNVTRLSIQKGLEERSVQRRGLF